LTENQYLGTGRRKSAIARVILKPGTGQFIVNGKPVNEVFNRQTHLTAIYMPLKVVNRENQFDVMATTNGGGISGQADAIKLGLARALERFMPDLRKQLKVEGCLTRDPREKERKKYGQKRARKRFQFSKR
jgi:small subunit ribosomal protein S9